MRDLPPSPFTVDQALSGGMTYAALKHALRQGWVVRLRRGVYADARADVSSSLAVPLTVDHAVVSHRSALLLHGLPVVGGRPLGVEITIPPRTSTNVASTHPYRARLRPHDVVVVQGAPTSAPARTVVDVARHWPHRTSVPAIDAALHQKLTTLEEIADVLEFCEGWPGIRRAKRAVALADDRAESPLESVSRLIIPRLGFPMPEPQTWILDPDGRVVGRGDFYFPGAGVVGESDGREKYGLSEGAYPREKDRQEDFEDLGLVVARWGWVHAWREHHVLHRKLTLAFERGARRDAAGFPRLWTPREASWRPDWMKG